ncbi:MAG: inositol monophosphatase family protein [Brevinematia bacterium]
MNYKEFLSCAIDASIEAGRVLKEGFLKLLEKGNVEFELKGYADPVTEYDKKSENIIIETILKKYPKSRIIAEESGEKDSSAEIRWIIDPLDGTVNFIHFIPFIAISIGIEVENKIIGGVIYNPIMNELYYASLGEGSFLNNRRIYVSKTLSPQYALVVTGFPYRREGRIEELLKPLRTLLKEYQGFRRLGAASIDLAYVARGSFEVFYEENLKPWDTAGGKIIVEEAGGKVTDYYGNEFSIFSNSIIASNGLIHNEIVKIMKEVKL